MENSEYVDMRVAQNNFLQTVLRNTYFWNRCLERHGDYAEEQYAL
jgi:hypothetical protein